MDATSSESVIVDGVLVSCGGSLSRITVSKGERTLSRGRDSG